MPRRRKDLTGQCFGRLTVIEYIGLDDFKKNVLWRCRCECGTERGITTSNLTQGRTQSCGCFNREATKERSTTHGYSAGGLYRSEYGIWRAMLARCRNPNVPQFKDYGGRGIRVCERWQKFTNFFEDMGARPPNMTLDRINNDGNYEPSNCRWATRAQQQANKHRASRN